MPIRDRVARLVAELPQEPQYPTQGATLFVDLERREVQRGYTPLRVIRTLLAGRGANMFYLHRLLDESLQPLASRHPADLRLRRAHRHRPERGARQCDVVVARVAACSWTRNAGDYFPSFIRMNGIDHIVLYGAAAAWTLLRIREGGEIEFVDARAVSSASTTSTCASGSRRTSAARGRAIWRWSTSRARARTWC